VVVLPPTLITQCIRFLSFSPCSSRGSPFDSTDNVPPFKLAFWFPGSAFVTLSHDSFFAERLHHFPFSFSFLPFLAQSSLETFPLSFLILLLSSLGSFVILSWLRGLCNLTFPPRFNLRLPVFPPFRWRLGILLAPSLGLYALSNFFFCSFLPDSGFKINWSCLFALSSFSP